MKKISLRNQQTKYRERVYRVLQEQHFIVGNKEKKLVRERTSNGRRYFFMVAKRVEGGKVVERFVKVPENNRKKLLLPFERQIEFAKYVKAHKIINTRGVISANCDPKRGIPFAIMETFPVGHSRIGFIEGNKGAELLRAREARRAIDQLKKFHAIPVKSLPPKLKKLLKVYQGDYRSFRRNVFRYLNKKVRPLDAKRGAEPFYRVLERRLRVSDLKGKVAALLDRMHPIIDSKKNKGTFLVHGDVAPNNLYVFDSGDVELLDLEWVGTFKNRAIAMIRDFGNLRARSWINEGFRKALDAELIKAYRLRGQQELGEAIVQLSILRSHIHLSSFFENYKWAKQKDPIQTRRRKSTEGDILQAFGPKNSKRPSPRKIHRWRITGRAGQRSLS